jgi:hypothetical protein
MLREGIEAKGESIDLDGLADPDCTEIAGIPNSEALLKLANAFMGDDKAALAAARDNLANDMSPEAMIDAVGVASNFQRMVRIADSTGIPSEETMLVMAEDLCETLGINNYASAANSSKVSWIKKQFLKLVAIPQIKKVIKDRTALEPER